MIEGQGGEIAGDLDEEALSRIKSELVPGERLLWAGRPRVPTVPISSGFYTWGLLATVFLLLFMWFMRLCLHVGFASNESPAGVGIVCGVLGLLIVSGMVLNRRERRREGARISNILYALTDQRAIAWMPHLRKDATEVTSIHKGSSVLISRVEYADGSGDVMFRSRLYDEYGNFDDRRFYGFEGIENPRQLEALCRRTLLPENTV